MVSKNKIKIELDSSNHATKSDLKNATGIDTSKFANVVKNDVAKRTEKINATQTIDTSDLVKKADYDTKIVENEKKIPDHDKYNTNNDLNTFLGVMFDGRLKHAKLATNNDLNTVEKYSIRNAKKREKLQTFDLS